MLQGKGVQGLKMTKIASISGKTENRGLSHLLSLAKEVHYSDNASKLNSMANFIGVLGRLELPRYSFGLRKISAFSDYIAWRVC